MKTLSILVTSMALAAMLSGCGRDPLQERIDQLKEQAEELDSKIDEVDAEIARMDAQIKANDAKIAENLTELLFEQAIYDRCKRDSFVTINGETGFYEAAYNRCVTEGLEARGKDQQAAHERGKPKDKNVN